MGRRRSSKKKKSSKKYETESDTSSSSSTSSPLDSSSDSETSSGKRPRHRRRLREDKHRSGRSSRRREKVERRKDRRKVMEDKRRSGRKKKAVDDDGGSSSSEGKLEMEKNPEIVLQSILKRFPDVLHDLKQLLEMIDNGQAVDTRGLSDRSFVKQLRKLFVSLNLKESDNGIFLLPPTIRPTLEVIGPMITMYGQPSEQQSSHPDSQFCVQSVPLNLEHRRTIDESNDKVAADDSAPRKRVIGPAMPSAELLAAAAKLTEAEAELREAEIEFDDDLFIGPPPAAVAAEAASANEAERFEEVTKIMESEPGSPYDVLGVNRNMSADNIKKRYWKLSLMVHPDKCAHPQAHQAFVILNKAFKELQDPDKRKAMDDKIRVKEEQEAFKAELKAMREAAQWRRLQGISMEGDDELLAEIKVPPSRDEWMTTLPPERKAGGVSMHSTTSFSRTNKEGRGDTSIWTDTPDDKTKKAKMNYLEAYNQATALASNEENKRSNTDADLVDRYNLSKRSKSLVEKHQEESTSRPKKKSKQERKKEEWAGQHPWKPWDREKDLTAGRQNVNLDAENMVKGLTSRFSSGNVQRNFL